VEVRHASFAVTEEGVSCSTLLVSRYTFRGEPSGPVPDFQLRAGRTGKMRVEGAGHRQSDVKTASSVSLPVAGTRIVLIIGHHCLSVGREVLNARTDTRWTPPAFIASIVVVRGISPSTARFAVWNQRLSDHILSPCPLTKISTSCLGVILRLSPSDTQEQPSTFSTSVCRRG